MTLFRLARPLLLALDPERAHDLTISALWLRGGGIPPFDPPMLGTRLAGMALSNPVGLAAGFDKDAYAFPAMLAFGFGFVEVGTLTPRPQPGNPRPRVLRLPKDRAVINRLGFNNRGQAAALCRLAAREGGVVGVNIGANADSTDRIADYAEGVARMAPHASYLTINISSPNTPGLRDLQTADALAQLLARALDPRPQVPVFLKIAPDLSEAEIDAVADVALSSGIAGIIATNTTIARPPLRSPGADFAGGLSGAPLRDPSTAILRQLRRRTRGRIALIGVGGIGSAADAYARIRAGADAVQLYTALVYEGPGLIARIKKGLAGMLERDGFTSVGEAVGVEA